MVLVFVTELVLFEGAIDSDPPSVFGLKPVCVSSNSVLASQVSTLTLVPPVVAPPH
jgi:hypothetical protein